MAGRSNWVQVGSTSLKNIGYNEPLRPRVWEAARVFWLRGYGATRVGVGGG